MAKEKKSHPKSQKTNNPQFNTSQMGNDIDVNEQDGMDNATDGLMNDAQGQLENIKNAPQKAKNTIENAKNTVNNIKEAPKNIKNGISNTKNGIKNLGNNIKNAPKNVANAAKKTANNIKNVPKNIAKGAKNTVKMAQKAVKLAIKAVQTAIKAIKAAIKLITKAIQLAIKIIQAIIQFLIWLISIAWPVLLIALVVGLLVVVIHWFLDNDSTSDNKSLTSEQTEYNETTTDKDGNAKIVSYSGGTKVVEAFYQYFAEKSLWIVYDGVVHNDDKLEHDDKLGDVYTPLQYNTEEFDKKFRDKDTGEVIIADAEGRESMFYLNPNSLFVFDKYLHGEQIRFPEQIVQHVAYDYSPSSLRGADINEANDKSCLTDYEKPDNRFILKQLTDENRILNITSQKYKKVSISDSSVSNEFRLKNPLVTAIYVPDGDNKEIGVWDYGLGSILHYEKYLVKHEKRGSVDSFEVWDLTKQMNDDGTIWYGQNKLIPSYKDYRDDANKDNYDATEFFADLEGDDRLRVYTNETDPEDPELADEDTYFIDWVVTAAGDIVNDIVYEWADSGDPFTKTETEVADNMENYKERLVTDETSYTLTLTCTDSDTTKDIKKTYPIPIRDTVEGSIKEKTVTETKVFTAPTHVEGECDCELEEDESCTTTHHSDSCSTTYTYTYYEDFVEYWNGTSWQRTYCTYETDENINGYIKGTRWDKKPYYDGEPNMENFTGRRYYEDYLTHYKTWVPDAVSGFFNYDSLMKRINAANDEDLDKIIERSSATGTGSNSLTGGTAGTAGEGNNKFEKCYNGTYKEIIEKIWDGLISWGYSPEQAAGVLGNIAAESTYNPEAVNSNGGASGLCQWRDGRLTQLKNFASTYNGTDWTDLTSQIQFACMELDGENSYSYASNQWSGHATDYNIFMTSSDPAEIAKAMMDGWERPGESEKAASIAERQSSALSAYETLKDRTVEYPVEKVSPSGAGTGGGSGSSNGGGGIISSIWSWLKGVMQTIYDKVADLFGRDTYYNILNETERFAWTYHPVQESDVDYILQSIFAYTNGKVISEYYGKINDDFFEEYYTTLFSNPIGQNWYARNSAAEDNETVTQNKSKREKYYPDGCTKPLDECVLSSKTSNYGVYFKATDGQNVYSIADGTVYIIGEDDRYGGKYILIENGCCKTIYGHLKDIKVSENQSVSKGQVIATVEGDELFFGITTMTNNPIDPIFILPSFADIDYTFPTVGPYAGVMPRILQSQDAIRDYPYGSSTISKSGCGICAFAMVASALNGEIYSPAEIADTMDSIAKSQGKNYTYYYVPGKGSVGGVIFPELSKYYGLQCYEFSDGTLNNIKSQLDKGRIVVISIESNGSSIYKGDGHFIVIRGHVGDKFYVNDSANCYNENTLYTLSQIGKVKNARAIWK